MEELNAELEYKRLRKQILLSDQHRMQLLQELGEDVENFQPSPLPKRPDSIHYDNDDSEDDEDEDQEEDGDDDAEGGVAFFDPDQEEKDDKWLPPVDVGDPNRDWNNLFCMFQLTEKGIHMHSRNRGLEAIADLLDIVPEHVD